MGSLIGPSWFHGAYGDVVSVDVPAVYVWATETSSSQSTTTSVCRNWMIPLTGTWFDCESVVAKETVLSYWSVHCVPPPMPGTSKYCPGAGVLVEPDVLTFAP